MMQLFLVIIAILISTVYLGQKAYVAFFSKKKSCEGCSFSKTTESLK